MSSNQTSWSNITGSMSVLFQNGVAGGSTDGPTQLDPGYNRSSNGRTDAYKGSPDRPKMLAVTQIKDFSTKHIRSDSDDADEGSLPCTPELQYSDSEACSAENEALAAETRSLIGRFLAEDSGIVRSRWTDGKPLSTMKRVVGGLLEKHRFAYNGMMSKLQLDERGDDMSFISDVAKQIFSDGTTNWGRIASLLALGSVVARHQKQKGKEECVETVAREISTYLLKEQQDWLIKNNAWDGFVEFFQEADTESIVRNTLMTVVGVAGIGATLAMLIR